VLDPIYERPQREVSVEHVGEQVPHAPKRYELLRYQIDRQCPHAWTVLRPTRGLGGKYADRHGVTGGTLHVQRAMFDDAQPNRRQVPYLAAFVQQHGHVVD
jgi:hypothetical protein